MGEMMLGSVTAWLLTYLIHSSVLIGAAIAFSRRLGERRLKLQELLIRAAMLGAIATSGTQLAANISPYAGRIEITDSRIQSAAAREADFEVLAPSAEAAASIAQSSTSGAPAPLPAPVALVASWEVGFVVAWFIGASVGLARLAFSRRQLDMLLRLSAPLTEGPLARTARSLARSLRLRNVRFSSSLAIAAPFTTGWRKTEVCFPHHALSRLPLSEQEGLCAHELAHAARGDAAWLAVYRTIEALFFFQPLNRLARVRLQELGECLADDDAAAFTRNRLALARSLVAVAEWTTGTAEPAFAVGALSARSALGHRIERLMTGRTTISSPARGMLVAIALLLSAAVLIVPGVSASGQSSESADPAGERIVESLIPPPAPPLAPPPRVAPVDAAAPAPPAPTGPQEPESAPAPPAAATRPAPVLADEEEEDHPDWHRSLEAEERLSHLDAEMERVGAQLAAQVADRHAQIAEIDASVAAMEAALAPTRERMEALGVHAEAIAAELAQVVAEQATLVEEALAAEDVRATGAEATELRAVVAAQREATRERMRALEEELEPSREQMEELRRQARELARQFEPSGEEMARLRALSHEIREAMREQGDELRQLARQAREAGRELRDEARRTREELHERAREERREMEQRAREHEREREERRLEREREVERRQRENGTGEADSAKKQPKKD